MYIFQRCTTALLQDVCIGILYRPSVQTFYTDHYVTTVAVQEGLYKMPVHELERLYIMTSVHNAMYRPSCTANMSYMTKKILLLI